MVLLPVTQLWNSSTYAVVPDFTHVLCTVYDQHRLTVLKLMSDGFISLLTNLQNQRKEKPKAAHWHGP